ncbi:MAG: hypothetical protein ABIR30_15145 [Chitinophagaceae bacterium]
MKPLLTADRLRMLRIKKMHTGAGKLFFGGFSLSADKFIQERVKCIGAVKLCQMTCPLMLL